MQWARIEPLLPDRTPRRGGWWRDHRQVIDAIAFKYRTGCRGWTRPSASVRGREPTAGRECGRSTAHGSGSSSHCLPGRRRGFAEVAPKAPPVGGQDRLTCPGGGTLGEERGPVPADHLVPRPFRRSRCLLAASRSGSRSTRRRVSTSTRTVSAARRPGAGPCSGRRRRRRRRRAPGPCGTRPGRPVPVRCRPRRAKPFRPRALLTRQPRYLLGKRPPPTGSIRR
ncbi:transposase [Streptomyces sp. NPDC006514]|uniref:transposase n=1 Tax=Streptomyces sp. NPDC006514 TaxID=3154308 RepID=UPI0033A1A3AC